MSRGRTIVAWWVVAGGLLGCILGGPPLSAADLQLEPPPFEPSGISNRPTARRSAPIVEGTRIRPTAGRVRRVGDRFVFQTFGDAEGDTERGMTDSPRGGSGMSGPAIATGDWTLVESRMLARIAEALRHDGHDDRWRLGGDILEFEGRNWLLIRTAVRDSLPSHPQP